MLGINPVVYGVNRFVFDIAFCVIFCMLVVNPRAFDVFGINRFSWM